MTLALIPERGRKLTLRSTAISPHPCVSPRLPLELLLSLRSSPPFAFLAVRPRPVLPSISLSTALQSFRSTLSTTLPILTSTSSCTPPSNAAPYMSTTTPSSLRTRALRRSFSATMSSTSRAEAVSSRTEVRSASMASLICRCVWTWTLYICAWVRGRRGNWCADEDGLIGVLALPGTENRACA